MCFEIDISERRWEWWEYVFGKYEPEIVEMMGMGRRNETGWVVYDLRVTSRPDEDAPESNVVEKAIVSDTRKVYTGFVWLHTCSCGGM